MNDLTVESKCRRRAGTQIILGILEYLNQMKVARKTWLLNASRLNSKNFEKHFRSMMDTKFIEYNGEYLVLTSNGKTYMDRLKGIHELDSISGAYVFPKPIGISHNIRVLQ